MKLKDTYQKMMLHVMRQAKIRQTVAENATHEKCRTFVWRGERSPCQNMKLSPFGGFSRGAFSPFRPEKAIIRHGTNQPLYQYLIIAVLFGETSNNNYINKIEFTQKSC